MSTYAEAFENYIQSHREWQMNPEDSDEPQAPNPEDYDEEKEGEDDEIPPLETVEEEKNDMIISEDSDNDEKELPRSNIDLLTDMLFDPIHWTGNLTSSQFLSLCTGPALEEAKIHQKAARLEAGLSLPDARADLPGAIHFLAFYVTGQRQHKVAMLQQMTHRLTDLAWDFHNDRNHLSRFNEYIELLRQNPKESVLHLSDIPRDSGALEPMILSEEQLFSLMNQYHAMIPVFAIVLSEISSDARMASEVFPRGSEYEDFKTYVVFMLQEISLFMYNVLSLAYEARELQAGRPTAEVYQWRSEAEQLHGWMKKFLNLTRTLDVSGSTSELQKMITGFFVAISSATPAPLLDTPEMRRIIERMDERTTRLQTNESIRAAERVITDTSLTMTDSEQVQKSSERLMVILRTTLGQVYSGRINTNDAGGRSWEWITSYPLHAAETLYSLWYQTYFLHAHIPAMLAYLLWKQTARNKEDQRKRDAFLVESFYCYNISKLRLFSPSKHFRSLTGVSLAVSMNMCPVAQVPSKHDKKIAVDVADGIKLRFARSQRAAPLDIWIQRMLPRENWGELALEPPSAPLRKKTKRSSEKQDETVLVVEAAKKEKDKVNALLLSKSSVSAAVKGARREDDDEKIYDFEKEEEKQEEEEEEELSLVSSKNRKRRVIEAEPELYPWERRAALNDVSPESISRSSCIRFVGSVYNGH